MEPDRQNRKGLVAAGTCSETPGDGEFMPTAPQKIEDIALSRYCHFKGSTANLNFDFAELLAKAGLPA